MFERRSYRGRNYGRRLIGLAILLSVCASAIPLPMSLISSPHKDRTTLFPCHDRPCGCGSATDCWKQCCCFTNAEKVAWARTNGVTPPKHVIEAAEAESARSVGLAANGSCRRCAESQSCEGIDDCCESDGDPESCPSPRCERRRPIVRNRSTSGSSPRFVISTELMKCRGAGLFWNSLPWAVVPVPDVPAFSAGPPSWDRPHSQFAAWLSAEPPEPPPRLG